MAQALKGNPGLADARMDRMLERTALERVEGTVLERWGIVVDDGTAEAVMERRGDGEGHGAPVSWSPRRRECGGREARRRSECPTTP